MQCPLATLNYGTSVEMFVPRLTKTIKKAKYITGDDGKQKWAGEYKQVGNWKRWVGGWEYSTKNVVFEPQQFARVLTHEIHHNLGKQHDDMVAVSALNCDYAAGFIVEPQQSPPKVSKEDRVQERAANAIAHLKRAETRLKRAQTLLKKWQKRVRYYRGVRSTES